MYKNLKNISLLIVDDDELMLELIVGLMEKKVKNIYQAKDAFKGLEVYKDKKPDLILTDYNMPNLNGLEMIKEIKKIDNDQIVVLLTGFDNEEILKSSIIQGVNGLVCKPLLDFDILFNTLEQKAKVINNRKELMSFRDFKEEKEKIYLIVDTVKSLSKQLKAPVDLVASVSNILLSLTKNDKKDENSITERIQESLKSTELLKYKLEKLENLDIENTTLEEIQRIVHLDKLDA